ncbi:MAG: 50S ribosomal protein L19 [Candidatus Hodgkinia cicadicola]
MHWLAFEEVKLGCVNLAQFGPGCLVSVRARDSKPSLASFEGICTKLKARAPWMCCVVRKVSSGGWVERRFCADAFSVKVCVKTKVSKTAALKFKFGRGTR